MQVIKGT